MDPFHGMHIYEYYHAPYFTNIKRYKTYFIGQRLCKIEKKWIGSLIVTGLKTCNMCYSYPGREQINNRLKGMHGGGGIRWDV